MHVLIELFLLSPAQWPDEDRASADRAVSGSNPISVSVKMRALTSRSSPKPEVLKPHLGLVLGEFVSTRFIHRQPDSEITYALLLIYLFCAVPPDFLIPSKPPFVRAFYPS
jgi:hypothetical protein